MTLADKTGYRETSLGWLPESWECVPQGEVVTFNNGRAYKLTEWESEGTPVIRLQNLTGSGDTYYYSNLELPPHQYVHKGDLLYMWSASFGPHIWRGEKAIYHYHIWKIDCSERVDRAYMFHALSKSTDETKNKLNGSTMLHLTKAGMEKEPIALPPLPEQQKIAAILTTVDDKLNVIARQIEATQTLKRGLMQTLFSRGVGTQDADGRWVPHAEFKDSELGEIPAVWLTTTLGGICNGALQTGPFGSQLHADEYQDEGIPVLMPKDLLNYRANLSTAARISPDRAEELAKHKVAAGDLLFSRRGDVARFALIDLESEGALCGTGCLKAKPSEAHSSRYIAHLLQLDVVRTWLEQNAVGQTMPNMNTGILGSLPLVAPVRKEEQEEIAGILDSVDAKTKVLSEKQSQFQALKRGLMQKLLTGEWRVKVDAEIVTA